MGIAYNSWPKDNNFLTRKAERREEYFNRRYGWRQCACLACNGSGKYDWATRGKCPKCGCCNGTGLMKFKGLTSLEFKEDTPRYDSNLVGAMIMLGYGDYII